MANKQLTAKVRIDASSAHKSLDKLIDKMKKIDQFMNKQTGGSGYDKKLTNALIHQEKLNQAVEKTNKAKAKTQLEQAKIVTQQLRSQYTQERITAAQQRSNKALADGDMAAQRLAQAKEKQARAEYEAWWAATLAKQEFQKAHPIVSRLATAWDKVNNKIKQSLSSNPKLLSTYDKIVGKVRDWMGGQNKVTSATKNTNSALNSVWKKLKGIASTYLGIMGMKALINTADVITGTENKLNYLNASQLGSGGYNSNGGYSQATFDATQENMDKMYASAQRVRMGYTDMMANVSKSMVLAGDAFKNNTDNAIRFQEIMAEAYTLGGAQPGEISSSMYQMIQALGAGILAGDELRSVREGAPLAYKEIEKFVQGVYNTEESLKDLASQGKVTSDMVVAAVMGMGDKLDEAFENTTMTFGQAWTKIKNAATKAFEPFMQKLTEILNKLADSGILDYIASALTFLGDILLGVLTIVEAICTFVVNNWSIIAPIIYALGAIIALALIGKMIVLIYQIVTTIWWYAKLAVVIMWTALKAVASWIMVHWVMLSVILIIAVAVVAIVALANTTVSGCEFMVYALLIVAAAILLIGIVTGNVWMIWVAVIIAALAIFLAFAQEIVGAVYWVGAFIYNIIAAIVNTVAGALNWILALAHNCIAGIVNFAVGLWNVICAVAQNIGIAFENAWIWCQNTFWSFVESVLTGLQAIIEPISALASLIGLDFSLNSTISHVKGKQQEYKSFVSIGDAWNKGMSTMAYKDLGQAWNDGWNTMQFMDMNEAYNAGASVGKGIQDTVGAWGDSIKNAISDGTELLMDKESKTKDKSVEEALKTSAVDNPSVKLEDANKGNSLADPSYSLNTDDFDATPIEETAKNTGKMADSMELAEEDLEYLRRIAEMEWKKEFTTANIVVDMHNNNTINGENDLDGWLTKLSDKLYEELDMVANGVYSY